MSSSYHVWMLTLGILFVISASLNAQSHFKEEYDKKNKSSVIKKQGSTDIKIVQNSFKDEDIVILHRSKRSNPGFPDNITDTMTTYIDQGSAASAKTGAKVTVTINSWWPAGDEHDVIAEVYMPTGVNGAVGNQPMFLLDSVVYAAGSNFISSIKPTDVPDMITYSSVLGDNMYYKASIPLGLMKNTAATSGSGDSEFTIAVTGVVGQINMTNGGKYFMGGGINYNDLNNIFVSNYELTYAANTIAAQTTTFEFLNPPTTIMVGGYATFMMKLSLGEYFTTVVLEVFGSLYGSPNVVSVVELGYGSGQGSSYSYVKGGQTTVLQSYTVSGVTVNNVTRFNLGQIVNMNMLSGSATSTTNEIILRAVIYMLPTATPGTTYTIGAGVNINSAIHITQTDVTAVTEANLTMITPPTVSIYKYMSEIKSGNHYAVYANVSFTENTMQRFTGLMELGKAPFVSTMVKMDVVHVGSNINLFNPLETNNHTLNATDDPNVVDSAAFSLGLVFCSGLGTRAADNTIVFRFTALAHTTASGTGTFNFGIASPVTVSVASDNYTVTTGAITMSGKPNIRLVNVTSSNRQSSAVGLSMTQAVTMAILVPGSQLTVDSCFPLAPIHVTTPYYFMSITKISVWTLGAGLYDLDPKTIYIQYNSAFSGSLFEEAIIHFSSDFFITNVYRWALPWDPNPSSLTLIVHFSLVHEIADTTLLNNTHYHVKVFSDDLNVSKVVDFSYSAGLSTGSVGSPLTLATGQEIPTTADLVMESLYFAHITVSMSNGSIANDIVATAESSDQTMRLCRLSMVNIGASIGRPIVPKRFPILTDISGDGRPESGVLSLGRITNMGYNNVSTAEENQFQIVAIFQAESYVIANFVASAKLTVTSNAINHDVTRSFNILDAVTAPAVSSVSPIFSLRNGTGSILIGTYQVIQLTLTTALGKPGTYTVTFTVPSNQAKLSLSKPTISFAGENLPCLNPSSVTSTLEDVSGSGTIDKVTMSLGRVVNSGISNETIESQFTIELPVKATSAATTSDTLSVDASILVDAATFTESLPMNVTATPHTYAFQPNVTMVPPNTTVIPIQGKVIFEFDIYLPESSNELVITVDSQPTSTQNVSLALMLPSFTNWGANYAGDPADGTTVLTSSLTGSTAMNNIVRTLKVTNTGISKRTTSTYHHGPEDLLRFEFSVTATDIDENLEGTMRLISVSIAWGTSYTYQKTFNVTITDPPNRFPALQVVTYAAPFDISSTHSGDIMQLKAQVNHTWDSTATAFFVDVFVYIPYFFSYLAIGNAAPVTPLSSTYIANQSAVRYTFERVTFTDNITLSVNVTLDPNNKLPEGVLEIDVGLPGYVVYYFANRSAPVYPSKSVPASYGPVAHKVILSTYDLSPLGLTNGVIQDCQIQASASDTTGPPVQVRSTGTGWIAPHRGTPFTGKEYIQINMGNLTLLTGITFYTAAHGSQVKALKVQSSLEGVIWNDFIYNGTSNILITSYYINNTYFLKLPTALKGRKFRVIPISTHSFTRVSIKMEIHGSIISSDVGSASVCPNVTAPSALYTERSFLVLGEWLYVCMIPGVGLHSRCYTTTDLLSWFTMDETVANIQFYDLAHNLYGISRNKISYVRSSDRGVTWYGIPKADFDAKSAASGSVQRVSVPFTTGLSNSSTTYQMLGSTRTFTADYLGISVSSGYILYWSDGSWVENPTAATV